MHLLSAVTKSDYKNELLEATDCIIVLDVGIDIKSKEYLFPSRSISEKMLVFLPKTAEQEFVTEGQIQHTWGEVQFVFTENDVETCFLEEQISDRISLLKLAKFFRKLTGDEPQQSLIQYTKIHEPILTVLRDEFALFLLYFLRNIKTISLPQLQNEFPPQPDFNIEKYISMLENAKLITITNDKIESSPKSHHILRNLDLSLTQNDLNGLDREIEQLENRIAHYANEIENDDEMEMSLRSQIVEARNLANEAESLKAKAVEASKAAHSARDYHEANRLSDEWKFQKSQKLKYRKASEKLRNDVNELVARRQEKQAARKLLIEQLRELKRYRNSLTQRIK